jgi:hypothetical protein
MDQADLEGEAVALLAAGGFDDDAPAPMAALARRLLGHERAVLTVHARSLPGDAALVRVLDEHRVYLRRGLDRTRARFAVAHELAEWALHRAGYQGAEVEDVADRLAAALVLPARAYRRLRRAHGDDWAAIGEAATATEAHACLRHGEVTGEPLALVARRLRVRGEPWAWPAERELRAVAAGRREREGLHRVPLADRAHVAVVAA